MVLTYRFMLDLHEAYDLRSVTVFSQRSDDVRSASAALEAGAELAFEDAFSCAESYSASVGSVYGATVSWNPDPGASGFGRRHGENMLESVGGV